MAHVICPSCKTGFEARISREDYALNCVSCGIAFNAAAFLPPEEFQACAERRPAAGLALSFDRGTRVLGNVIRPLEPPAPPAPPASPKTRTGGFPFMWDEEEPDLVGAEEAVEATEAELAAARGHAADCAQVRASAAVLQTAEHKALAIPAAAAAWKGAGDSFLEASTTTARFRAAELAATPAGSTNPLQHGPGNAAAPARLAPGASGPVGAAAASPASIRGSAPSMAKVQAPGLLKSTSAPGGRTGPTPRTPSSVASAVPVAPAAPARRRPLLEGTFGPYEIEGEIARGGVGAVFRAKEQDGGRKVALKVLLEGEEAGELERERFRRECETAKALALPGMVQIYAVGEVDGKPYMAMELVEGRSLDKLIHEKSLAVNDGLVLMQTVAETVGALHEAGYVHRDLKPANILLGPYGTPKVADFGLVKSLDEVTRLTASGLVCGTPAYMAPEQARGDGKAIDPRSDVWALGAVLYEILAAIPPFQADNALRLMLKITKDAPKPPRQFNPKVPRDVDAIVMKCLEKDPARRYPTARALAEDLKRFLAGQPVEAHTQRPVQKLLRAARKNRGVLAAVGSGVLAVALVALLTRLAFAPPNPETLVLRGWAALEAGKAPEAAALFRSALERDSRLPRAHLGLGRALGWKSIDRNAHRVASPTLFQEALAATAKAGELDRQFAGTAAAQAALLYRWSGNHADEAREWERAVRAQSENPEYHQNLAMAYWHLGAATQRREEYECALREFGFVLRLRPDYPKTTEYIKLIKERFLARKQAEPSGHALAYDGRR